ncbi:MAG: dTDP-4-dehydrorhamnose reductase [Verrucomicrobiales bacterium]
MPTPVDPSRGSVPGTRRIVLLGSNGRLGFALTRHLSRDPTFILHCFDRGQINLASPRLIDEVLGPLDFDLLINCAAYTAVDDCELQSGHAYLINGHSVGQLARLCAAKDARMIHFSTDYVFDGAKREPYLEDDLPNPLSVYGRSKLMGEDQVREAHSQHLVVRLSWLFGPHRPAFPEWVLRQAASGCVRVIADKISCPTYSEDVAEWLRPLFFGPLACGNLIHLCNPPACSWFDYACEILRCAKSPAQAQPISMADLPGLQAARPPYSGLAVTKYEHLTGRRCRPWREALAEHWMTR